MRHNTVILTDMRVETIYHIETGFKLLIDIELNVNGRAVKSITLNPDYIDNAQTAFNDIDGFGGVVNGTITFHTPIAESLPINIVMSYNDSDGTIIVSNYIFKRIEKNKIVLEKVN